MGVRARRCVLSPSIVLAVEKLSTRLVRQRCGYHLLPRPMMRVRCLSSPPCVAFCLYREFCLRARSNVASCWYLQTKQLATRRRQLLWLSRNQNQQQQQQQQTERRTQESTPRTRRRRKKFQRSQEVRTVGSRAARCAAHCTVLCY